MKLRPLVLSSLPTSKRVPLGTEGGPISCRCCTCRLRWPHSKKAEKIAALEEEKRAALERMENDKIEAMKELEDQLRDEQEKATKKMEEEKEEMQKKHKEDMESRMNELDDVANDEEKNKLIQKFNEEHSAQLDALEQAKLEKKKKLNDKLKARREKKRLALENRPAIVVTRPTSQVETTPLKSAAPLNVAERSWTLLVSHNVRF